MLHGLRHHFLTMHAVAGTLAPILILLATHKNLATTQRYIDIAMLICWQRQIKQKV